MRSKTSFKTFLRSKTRFSVVQVCLSFLTASPFSPSTGGRFSGAREEGADGCGANKAEAGGGSEAVHGLSAGLGEPEGRPRREIEKVGLEVI